MEIKTVSLIGLGAMGVYFAPRLRAQLGDRFRVIAGGARKARLASESPAGYTDRAPRAQGGQD